MIELLSTLEVKELLEKRGISISERRITALANQYRNGDGGALPAQKIANSWVFRREDVEQWEPRPTGNPNFRG